MIDQGGMKKLSIGVYVAGVIGLVASLVLMTDFLEPLLKIVKLSMDSAFGWLK